jgi:hypothetical protein
MNNNKLLQSLSVPKPESFYFAQIQNQENINNQTARMNKGLPSNIDSPRNDELFCEHFNTSLDETFLQQGSYDSSRMSSSIDVDYRPAVGDAAFLMKSFSTDEFNAVRNLTKNIMKPKLSLENPSALKGLKATWTLTSPSDRNVYASPSKTLKRKYKSRSSEDVYLEEAQV